MIDYFTEGVEEVPGLDAGDESEDLHIELVHQTAQPELEEFDLRIGSPEEMLGIEEQQRMQRLVFGVLDYHAELDEIIHRYAAEWPIDQIAIIDRNILRLAIYEFGISKEVPLKVAINEAVELAKIFGSSSAPRFVNGVLGAFAENSRALTDELNSMLSRRAKELEGA